MVAVRIPVSLRFAYHITQLILLDLPPKVGKTTYVARGGEMAR